MNNLPAKLKTEFNKNGYDYAFIIQQMFIYYIDGPWCAEHKEEAMEAFIAVTKLIKLTIKGKEASHG